MENLNGRTLFVAAVDAEAAHIPKGEPLLITGIGTVPAAIALTEALADARANGALPERVVISARPARLSTAWLASLK